MTETDKKISDMHSGYWHPTAPVLLKDVWTLAITYKADPEVIRRWLPPELEPHPDGRVEMTMYSIPDPNQTSGFGAFSLTYMTLEVAGLDGYSAEGAGKIPGRYWATYWNSSHRVRTYARESVGIPARPGACFWTRDGDRLTSRLEIDGVTAIELKADVTDEHAATVGGLLNYYTRRIIPSLDGAGDTVNELVHVPIPFVVEAYKATPVSLDFLFPPDDHVAELRPIGPVSEAELLYGKVTFTYSQARRIRNYLT
ncbi:MAG: acetoacetate decarboxylase family protein [Xanthobacteraceae bacterium]